VATVLTISLRQTRISGPKSRSPAFMSILIVFCILYIVAVITILLVGRGAMISINTTGHPELSLATEESTEVMSMSKSSKQQSMTSTCSKRQATRQQPR
jgi:hypothetical protein